jgi:hypothetical protein
MIEKEFKHASASEAGDYFQVLFEDEVGNIYKSYLLIQRQFEDSEDDHFYLESDDSKFCGHFNIKAATLSCDCLCLDLSATKKNLLRVKFDTGPDTYEEIKRILAIMFQDKIFDLSQDS